MKDGEHYIEYSDAKMGWCVYKHVEGQAARQSKEAGPYFLKADAETERDRLNGNRG